MLISYRLQILNEIDINPDYHGKKWLNFGLSLLAQNKDTNQISGTNVQDRGDKESQEGAGIGAVTGTILGGLGGLLIGLEALIIPGVSPLLAAGTIATTWIRKLLRSLNTIARSNCRASASQMLLT